MAEPKSILLLSLKLDLISFHSLTNSLDTWSILVHNRIQCLQMWNNHSNHFYKCSLILFLKTKYIKIAAWFG